jgi:hypothetical protein
MGINSACDKTVYRVDNMGSSFFDVFDPIRVRTGKNADWRVPQVVEIINDTDVRILKYADILDGEQIGGNHKNWFKNYYIN